MALSFALHGLAVMPLLLAGPSGGTPVDELVLLVDVALAAPAPNDATGPAGHQPSESSVDLPLPDQPPPVDASKVSPPLPTAVEIIVDVPVPDQPPPVEIAEIADRKVELPAPEEPPPLAMADLKPALPKHQPPPQPQAQAQPKPKAPAPANPAPAQKPVVTQTAARPDAGTDRITQTAAVAQPAIMLSQQPRFRTPPVQAPYPRRAIELGQQGDAVLRVRLEPDGSIAEIVLWRSSGHDLLDKSALATVRGYQFLPEMRNGHAVAAWVEFPIRFHLR